MQLFLSLHLPLLLMASQVVTSGAAEEEKSLLLLGEFVLNRYGRNPNVFAKCRRCSAQFQIPLRTAVVLPEDWRRE